MISWSVCQSRPVGQQPVGFRLHATFISNYTSALAYALFNTSASIAKMVKNGLRVHIGAHGEPPLGLNYHAEMAFTRSGGLDNYEVWNACTLKDLFF